MKKILLFIFLFNFYFNSYCQRYGKIEIHPSIVLCLGGSILTTLAITTRQDTYLPKDARNPWDRKEQKLLNQGPRVLGVFSGISLTFIGVIYWKHNKKY